MNSCFKIVVLCIAASTVTATSVSLNSVKSRAVVGPKGNVPEYADCGSLGTVLGVEVADCDSKPCFLTTNQNYAIAISFTAANASSTLQLKSRYYDFEQNEYQFVDQSIPGSVAPGMQYRVNYDNNFVPVSIGGTHGFIEIQVWDNTLNQSAACALILAAIREP